MTLRPSTRPSAAPQGNALFELTAAWNRVSIYQYQMTLSRSQMSTNLGHIFTFTFTFAVNKLLAQVSFFFDKAIRLERLKAPSFKICIRNKR